MGNEYEAEEYLVGNGRGKWSQAGVPHKGWTCIEIEDLGRLAAVCEMCESQQVRYVHHMQHPEHAAVLGVGCICAGHMESDLTAARRRDKKMKSRASKRKRWLSRRWKQSKKGNDWIEADGFRVTVYKAGNRWGATVAAQFSDFVQHIRRRFPTEDQAKLAAFDLITTLTPSPG